MDDDAKFVASKSSFDDLIVCWPATIGAGVIYAWIVVLILAIWEFYSFGFAVLPRAGEALLLFLVASLVGMVIASTTGLLAFAVVWVINKSFVDLFSIETSATIMGGLAGYLPFGFLVVVSGQWTPNLMVFFLGPILASVVGSLFVRISLQHLLAPKVLFQNADRKFALTIRKIMVGTAWFGVLLTLGNLIGIENFFYSVACWVAIQATICVCFSIVFRSRPRLPKR